jgi:hypothetical protein
MILDISENLCKLNVSAREVLGYSIGSNLDGSVSVWSRQDETAKRFSRTPKSVEAARG